MIKKSLFVIAGPTASGKTAVARQLIKNHPFEIISADSRQVYRGLDIGTGKDKSISQAMIDVVDPGRPFSVSDYQKQALPIIDQIFERNHHPLVVGGTGFYIDALIYQNTYNQTTSNPGIRQKIDALSDEEILKEIEKIDPETAGTIDRHNRVRLVRALEIIRQTNAAVRPLKRVLRPNLDVHIYVIDLPREELYENIDTRVDERMKQGMVKEVEGLIASGISKEWLLGLGLEYRFVTQYLLSLSSSGLTRGSDSRLRENDKMTYPEMVERLKYAIHDYARRQITYFRRWPKAEWLSASNILAEIDKIMRSQ